jgi:GNAT superfamily N-acetyltransferase
VITFERIGPQAPPFVLERLAAIFSSDPEFLETTEGARAFCVDDVVRYLENEEAMRAEAYAIVREADGTILGVVTLLPHHPREPHPWIGLLLVDVGARGRGLGSQAADLAESTLRARLLDGAARRPPPDSAVARLLGGAWLPRRRGSQDGRGAPRYCLSEIDRMTSGTARHRATEADRSTPTLARRGARCSARLS